MRVESLAEISLCRELSTFLKTQIFRAELLKHTYMLTRNFHLQRKHMYLSSCFYRVSTSVLQDQIPKQGITSSQKCFTGQRIYKRDGVSILLSSILMRAVLPALGFLHLCFEPQLQYQCLHSVDEVSHCHYHQQDPANYNLANSKTLGNIQFIYSGQFDLSFHNHLDFFYICFQILGKTINSK